MKTLLAVTILLPVLLVGCAHTNVTYLKDYGYKPKVQNCRIEVMTVPPANKKFDEFAIISVEGGQTIFEDSDLQAMLPDLKQAGCELGADAILLKAVNEGGPRLFGPKDPGQATAVALKYIR